MVTTAACTCFLSKFLYNSNELSLEVNVAFDLILIIQYLTAILVKMEEYEVLVRQLTIIYRLLLLI